MLGKQIFRYLDILAGYRLLHQLIFMNRGELTLKEHFNILILASCAKVNRFLDKLSPKATTATLINSKQRQFHHQQQQQLCKTSH